MLTYYTPLHATVVRDGDGWNKSYNIEPAKAVSSGPYVLKEYTPERVVAEINPNYPADLQPYIQKVISIVLPPEQRFQAYQANQIDHMQLIQTADIEAVLADPELSKQVTGDVGDFRCDYMFFDVTKAPFDNKKFRQAISHLVDRDAIIENITKPLASQPGLQLPGAGLPRPQPGSEEHSGLRRGEGQGPVCRIGRQRSTSCCWKCAATTVRRADHWRIHRGLDQGKPRH